MGCCTQQGVEIKAQSEPKCKLINSKNKEIKIYNSNNNHGNNKENKNDDVNKNPFDIEEVESYDLKKNRKEESKEVKSEKDNKDPLDELEEVKSEFIVKAPLDKLKEVKFDKDNKNPLDEAEEVKSEFLLKEVKSDKDNKNPLDAAEEVKSEFIVKNPKEELKEIKSDKDIKNPLDEAEEVISELIDKNPVVKEEKKNVEIPLNKVEIESDKEVNEKEKSKYPIQLNIKIEKKVGITNVIKLSDEKIAVLLRDEKELRIYSLKDGKLCFTFKEKEKIYSVKELSDEKIAVLLKDEKELRIYSLKSGKLCFIFKEEEVINYFKELKDKRILFDLRNKLKIYSLEKDRSITTINQADKKKYFELKNNDLIIYSTTEIFFYKLKKDYNYELYQTIDESNQEINKTKKRDLFRMDYFENDDKYYINNVYEISKGDLVSCNSYGIKIYKKELNGQYKLSIMNQIREDARYLLEINNNILIIYGNLIDSPSYTFFSESYSLNKYDIENQKMTEICRDHYSDRKGRLKGIILGFEYLYHKNFLFIGFCETLAVLDLNKNGEIMKYFNGPTGVHQFLFNFDDDNFLIKDHDDKYKLIRYKNNKFEFVRYFPFKIGNFLKLNNNKFITYSENEIILYQNLINN